jgi:hypothetical protein
MKKLKRLIKNVYRICIVNPAGRKRYISYNEETDAGETLMPDSIIRRIIATDQLHLDIDPQISEMLRQRVKTNGHHSAPVKNSLPGVFLPLFSARHIEIKMAFFSMALFILVGLGPKNNPASDRKFNLFFLADTLGDSSSFHHPAAQDTAFRVQFK